MQFSIYETKLGTTELVVNFGSEIFTLTLQPGNELKYLETYLTVLNLYNTDVIYTGRESFSALKHLLRNYLTDN